MMSGRPSTDASSVYSASTTPRMRRRLFTAICERYQTTLSQAKGFSVRGAPPICEKQLRKEVQELLKEAEAVDEEEDKRYGRERQGEELPEELQRRETRIARIQEAKKALEERAREKAESEGKDRKGAEPEPKAQYNFTDPESRILKGSNGFVQGYNTQVAVEPIFQLIVGQAVTQAAGECARNEVRDGLSGLLG